MDGRSLAEKPNLVSLLRCRWGEGRALAAPFVLRCAADVASALAYMHARRICHGDVYAHNVLAAEDGAAVLCDYGAPASLNPHPAHSARVVVDWHAKGVGHGGWSAGPTAV